MKNKITKDVVKSVLVGGVYAGLKLLRVIK